MTVDDCLDEQAVCRQRTPRHVSGWAGIARLAAAAHRADTEPWARRGFKAPAHAQKIVPLSRPYTGSHSTKVESAGQGSLGARCRAEPSRPTAGWRGGGA